MILSVMLRDAVGSVLIAGAVLTASTSGQGGGALIVPILLLCYSFTPSQAVALTNVTIFGSALASLVTNVHRKHPDVDNMPLIDFDAVLIMEPATMVGAILGSLVHRFLHSWQLLCLLDVILVALAVHVTSKGLKDWRATQEYEEQQSVATTEATESSDSTDDEEGKMQRTLSAEFQSLSARVHSVSIADELEGGWAGLATRVSASSSTARLDTRIAAIFAVFSVIVALNLGKCAGELGVYYAVNASICVWVVAVTVVAGVHLRRKWKQQPPPPAGVDWSPAATAVLCPLACVAAGFFAGTFGIGGGFVKTPLLQYLGLPPEAAAATSSAMIFFTSLISFTSLAAFGHFWAPPQRWYEMYFFAIGVGATALGGLVGRYLVGRRHRAAVTQLAMGTVMACSALLMTLQTLLMPHEEKPLAGGFEALCSK